MLEICKDFNSFSGMKHCHLLKALVIQSSIKTLTIKIQLTDNHIYHAWNNVRARKGLGMTINLYHGIINHVQSINFTYQNEETTHSL